ncbi:MAG: amino acid-binding ACT protein [Acidimicrobiales bacterium]|nr:amino acid-binding ACT protein [Acidimicrobiales bacterium]RZV44516.1 MAG: amino acid-binding ACT protein [Acidimicrobiales bacterium]
MAALVITAIGDDRAGLVEALSGVIATHGGNWDRSHMAELAGKFAGIVLVTVPDSKAESLIADLKPLETKGLLDITVEAASDAPDAPGVVRGTLNLVGQDHPGIVHEISHVLATAQVSIDELETETVPAPQGGHLFKAQASLEVPAGTTINDLYDALEAVSADLMVDLQLDA